MRKNSQIVVDFTDQHDKVLNPHQRIFLEDTKRVKEKIEQLNHGNGLNSFMRKEEEASDPDEMDKRDSFYHTTKSLLVLFQIMGVMPIQRSPKGTVPRTSFSYTSRVHFWAYFIYALETIVVYTVAKERFIQFISKSDKKFDEIIYNVIFLSILAPHFLLPVASWRHGSEVAIFKNMWTSFQLKYLKVTGTTIEFPILYRITWFLCFFSWGISFGLILSQFYLQPDFYFYHTFAYYHIIAMLNGFCSLWYINCTAFGLTSRAFSLQLKATLTKNKPAKKLAEFRNMWVDLSHMMQQLGKAYSNMYGIYCLIIFFTVIIASFGSLSEIIDHGFTFKELGLFMIVIYCMSLLFIICNEAHHASRRVGLKFQEILLNVNLTTVDIPTQKEIEMFLVAIEKNPPTMNLDGYANINRQLITSNISFMATYLVVLMQFKLSLLRQTVKKSFDGSEDVNLNS
ncbi:CLUMA_CG014388, isoform A [Clunio marinus]|uniref:Gustatory receptor n=1 Tax=Clunio marinus TaxID=568069 RepID=A0A1J1IQB3_9DIPT|nr:CLUMA_CG014388, isoform A [Clunio marinus]